MRPFLAVPDANLSPFLTIRRRHETRIPFTWHYHQDFELSWIIDGHGRRFVGDSIADFGNDDFMLIGPRLPHTYVTTTTCEFVVLHVPSDLFVDRHLQHPQLSALKRLFQRSRRGLVFHDPARKRAIALVRAMLEAAPLRRLAHLIELLECLADADPDAVEELSRQFPAFGSNQELAPVDRVFATIERRFRDRLPVHEVAEVAGMSLSAFTRYFKRATGKTFNNYLNDLRIRAACHRLLETEDSINEIARASGFPNVPYFNRRFLSVCKMAPGDYRRKHLRNRRR